MYFIFKISAFVFLCLFVHVFPDTTFIHNELWCTMCPDSCRSASIVFIFSNLCYSTVAALWDHTVSFRETRDPVVLLWSTSGRDLLFFNVADGCICIVTKQQINTMLLSLFTSTDLREALLISVEQRGSAPVHCLSETLETWGWSWGAENLEPVGTVV